MMKCKGCNNNIKDNLELVEEAIIVKVTQILDLIPPDEDDSSDNSYELILGKVEEEEEDFEVTCYQCSRCYTEYSYDEVKEIFKKGKAI